MSEGFVHMDISVLQHIPAERSRSQKKALYSVARRLLDHEAKEQSKIAPTSTAGVHVWSDDKLSMYARSPVHGSRLLMFCSRGNFGRESDARKEGDVVRIAALSARLGFIWSVQRVRPSCCWQLLSLRPLRTRFRTTTARAPTIRGATSITNEDVE